MLSLYDLFKGAFGLSVEVGGRLTHFGSRERATATVQTNKSHHRRKQTATVANSIVMSFTKRQKER